MEIEVSLTVEGSEAGSFRFDVELPAHAPSDWWQLPPEQLFLLSEAVRTAIIDDKESLHSLIREKAQDIILCKKNGW